MQGEIRTKGDAVEVVISGAMMFSEHKTFNELMDTARGKNKGACIIDLAGLTEIDSSGIGMLLLAYDESQKENKALSLRDPIESVRKILEHCKIDLLIPIESAA